MSSQTEEGEVCPLFKEVQEDSDICNNCFRRTHVTYERNFSVTTFNGELWAKEIEAPDRSYKLPDQTTYVPGVNASEGTHVYCTCGCYEAIRPVTTQRAMEHAKRLYDRLEEMGADVGRDVLLDEVRHRVTQPENQCQLDSVLSEAVQCSRLREL